MFESGGEVFFLSQVLGKFVRRGSYAYETMGLSGMCGLCILGNPYILVGDEPVDLILILLYMHLVNSPLLCSRSSIRTILVSCVAVGSFFNFL